MMEKTIYSDDFKAWDRIPRLKFINCITGLKPANLVGTRGKDGITNAAVFSSAVHLGSSPALIGLISRPATVERHTLSNILETKYYTLNHVSEPLVKAAHWSSAKWPKDTSEFKKLGIREQQIDDFPAPFVWESPIKIGLKLEQTTDLINGTILVIGSVQLVSLREDLLRDDHSIDLDKAGSLAISGLDEYHSSQSIARYPYARQSNWEV